MNKTKIWAGVLAVFFAGVVVGVAGGVMFSRYQIQQRFEDFRKMPSESITKVILRKINQAVTLTEQQSREIEPLIADGAKQADKTMEATHREMQQHLQQLFLKIKAKLTPEQRDKFDVAVKKGLLMPPGPPPMDKRHGPPPPPGNDRPWEHRAGPPPSPPLD